jgi:hypothetical protein
MHDVADQSIRPKPVPDDLGGKGIVFEVQQADGEFGCGHGGVGWKGPLIHFCEWSCHGNLDPLMRPFKRRTPKGEFIDPFTLIDAPHLR